MPARKLTFSVVKDHLLAGFLLLFALYLMFTRNIDGLGNLRSLSLVLVSYIEQPLSAIRVYRTALNTNDVLQRQNILLNDELSKLRSAETEIETLRQLFEYQGNSPLDLYPVRVVGKQLNGINNSMTISGGKNHGIEIGMPLVTSAGLVGRVVLVNDEFAQVMPYTHSLFRVSARVQGSRAYGIINWGGNQNRSLTMDYVPQTVRVRPGDVVETSGYSLHFPAGLLIGRVLNAKPVEGRDYQQIQLEPFVDLGIIAEGFVVRYQADSAAVELQETYEELFQ